MAHSLETRDWLADPGVVVNRLRGDAAETRAHGWLQWDGTWPLAAAVLGVPFDGASTVRPGARLADHGLRRTLVCLLRHTQSVVVPATVPAITR